jgi:hypothetical protein
VTSQSYDLQSHLNDLGFALARWEGRDDTKAQPQVRRAANTAMDAIDAMVAGLYQMRSRLVTEIRASDDANGARVDAMLSRPVHAPLPEAATDPARAAVFAKARAASAERQAMAEWRPSPRLQVVR